MGKSQFISQNVPLGERLGRLGAARWIPALVLLFCCGITFLLVRYELAEEAQRTEVHAASGHLPALQAAKELARFSHGPLICAVFGVSFGILLAALTWLLLRNCERSRANEQRWKFALEGSGDGIWDWNLETGQMTFSKRWKEMLGFAEHEIGGAIHEWQSRIHPEDAARAQAELQTYLDRKTDLYTSEHRVRCKDGGYKWIRNRGMATSSDQHGRPSHIVGTASDTTQNKRSEEARMASMALQRDVLVREVHHRIKNNLQGVAGLLRQHAAKRPEIGFIIDQAVAQVQTVAIVHGLQGRASDNEVVLCEMAPAISRMAETLMTPRPTIDIGVDVPQRIRVAEQETVPIALVLNELIINAIKHSRGVMPPHIAITVSWDQERTLARIDIVNLGTLPADFDFASGTACGTGLDLVRSLLPPQGACLTFTASGGMVKTTIELAAPSIFNLQDDGSAHTGGKQS